RRHCVEHANFRMDGFRLDATAATSRCVALADEYLRGSPRILAKKIHERISRLSRNCRAIGRVREANGFYSRRIPACRRARFLSVVGLSGHWILRTNEPIRHP